MYETSITPGENLTFATLFGWAAALARSPRRFLRDMAKKGGYGTPILYLAFWTFAASFVGLLVSFVRPSAGGGTAVVRLSGLIVASEEVHGLPRDRSLIVWGIICGFFLLMGLLGITLVQFARNLPPNFQMPSPGSMVR